MVACIACLQGKKRSDMEINKGDIGGLLSIHPLNAKRSTYQYMYEHSSCSHILCASGMQVVSMQCQQHKY